MYNDNTNNNHDNDISNDNDNNNHDTYNDNKDDDADAAAAAAAAAAADDDDDGNDYHNDGDGDGELMITVTNDWNTCAIDDEIWLVSLFNFANVGYPWYLYINPNLSRNCCVKISKLHGLDTEKEPEMRWFSSFE